MMSQPTKVSTCGVDFILDKGQGICLVVRTTIICICAVAKKCMQLK